MLSRFITSLGSTTLWSQGHFDSELLKSLPAHTFPRQTGLPLAGE